LKLTQEELNKLIADEVAKLAPSVDMEEVGKIVDDKLKEAIKPVDKKIVANDDPTEKGDPKGGFYNFAEFAQAVAIADKSHGRNLDKRLVALEQKAAGDGLTELVDSEGGYGINAHQKPDYMLETPKVLMTTKVIL